MKQLYLLLTILSTFLQGCTFSDSGIWNNENIDPTEKAAIKKLNDLVIKSINENNSGLLYSIASDKLKEVSGPGFSDLLAQINKIVTTTEYDELNQFYVKNSKKGIANTVMTGVSGQDDYRIQYEALNDEMFISLIVPKTGMDKFLITNIYGKYPDGWKLNIMHVGPYKISNKTATELYAEARTDFQNGNIIDAGNKMFLSTQILKPAGTYWKYQKEDEINAFFEGVIDKIKKDYPMPMTLSELESSPQIFNIYPQKIDEGYFPSIEYVTNLDLKDTISTKAENDKIHQIIGSKFKGIDKGKKYLFYKAYKQMPDGKTLVPTYGFVKKL